jgi:hypothetical protein
MSRRPLQSLKLRVTALALGLAVACGAAPQAETFSPGDSQLRSGDFAVTAQRESTTVDQVARSQPLPARVVARVAAPVFIAVSWSSQVPALGAGPFGDSPLSSACPPQGPPSAA